MANLYPTGYETEVVTLSQLAPAQPVGFRDGVLFNYETGDFPRNGRHRLRDSTALVSWESWARNCIQTERFKHRCYSTDFGLELDKAFRAPSREAAESILTRQINEAMLADPYGRTQYVESIVFDWEAPDAVSVTVTLHGLEDVTIDVTAYITRGGI